VVVYVLSTKQGARSTCRLDPLTPLLLSRAALIAPERPSNGRPGQRLQAACAYGGCDRCPGWQQPRCRQTRGPTECTFAT
jgi:hypothetical protein